MKRNLKTLKDIYNQLPAYLRHYSKKDTDNIEYISSGINNNTIRALASARDEAGADKAGRGITSALQFWDETAFLKYNNIIYGSSAPAAGQARIEARNNKKIYGTTMVTTPNNLEKPEAVWFKNTMINNACLFTEDFYDMKLSEIRDYINLKSRNDFTYIEFSYKQLGRSEEWFEEQCRALNYDLLLIKRELLLEWTKASDVSVYSEAQLSRIEELLITPFTKITLLKYWNFYLLDPDFDFRKPYLISVDPSAGTDNDGSAITIINPISLKPIAEFRENIIDTRELKKVIIELMTRYFINSILVMENNSIGKPILDDLMSNKLISNRIYYEEKNKMATKINYDMREITYTKHKNETIVYGITNTKESRSLMLELLTEQIENNPINVATPFLYSDIKGLERNKKGKIEHSIGGHDDSLFSYLIGIYTLTYGKNLNKFLLNRNVPNPREDRSNNIQRSVDFMDRMRKSNTITGTFSKNIINDFKDINTSSTDSLNSKYNIYNNFIGNNIIKNNDYETRSFKDVDEVINDISKYKQKLERK